MNTVSFDKQKLWRLKIAYKNAVHSKEEVFTFDNQEYLVAYAKYLIEYLESKLGA